LPSIHRADVSCHDVVTTLSPVTTAMKRLLGAVVALVLAVVLGFVTLRAADSATAASQPVPGLAPLPASQLPALVEAAKAEGRLQLIAMPSTWANYGQIIAAFENEYGIDVTVASPNATSAQELSALRMMKGQSRQPDLVEVGPSFAQTLIDEGFAQPYMVSVWDQLPSALKDPNGFWTAPYYGIISFGTNTDKVAKAPTSWKDLDDPMYKGAFGLNGDPRSATSAMSAVWSASLANGGSLDDITPGIRYFGGLSSAGIYVPLQANAANLANEQITVVGDWSFNMPGDQSVLSQSGIGFEVTTPSDGLFGSYYVNAITAGAPHPNAARLWMEWVTALQGRQLYLAGGAIPALYQDMVQAGQVPADVQATFPSASVLASLQFADQQQQATASDALLSQWGSVVG
jgi:putative spermidine/putrescine transport system substrate-binding protein